VSLRGPSPPGRLARAQRRAPPEVRIRAATEGWFITEPLLFGAFLTHRLSACPGIQSIRIGGGRVEYNPAFVDALPDRDLQELLRLEAVRIVLKHPYARRPASGEIAYLASNITLKEHVPTRLPLPSAAEVFGDAALDRQYYELYCDRLLDQRPSPGLPPQPSQAAGDEEDEGDGDGEGAEEGSAAPVQAAGGSAGGSEVKAHLEPARGPENTQLWEEDTMARELIDAVIRESEQSGQWGSLPGSLVAQILATLRPRLDYQKMLRRFRTSILSSRRELTRMKPSRRYGFVYMGSRHRLRTRLLVAVDVSGSIGDEDLEKAFSVINRLFQYGVESIDVVQFDTQLTGPVTPFRKRRRTVHVTGRGGTSFTPVLAYIDEHRAYDGLIIVTDGAAPRPDPPKNQRTRVLWLFHHEHTFDQMCSNVEHLGEAVFIKPDPDRGSRGHRRPR
jgi:predicted metal-dependent peptidase